MKNRTIKENKNNASKTLLKEFPSCVNHNQGTYIMQAYCDGHVILFLLFNFRPSMHYSFNSDFESLLQKRTIISDLISGYGISEYKSSYATLSLLPCRYCPINTALSILPCQYCPVDTVLSILSGRYCPVNTVLSILSGRYCPVDTALYIAFMFLTVCSLLLFQME